MAGTKGKSGVYTRSESQKKAHSLANSGSKNGNWKGGFWRDNKTAYFRDAWQRYRLANQDRLRSLWHSVRAKRKSAPGSFSEIEWSELKKKCKEKCVDCGRKLPLTPDHIVPLCKGGTNYIENIQPMCYNCNRKKGRKIISFL